MHKKLRGGSVGDKRRFPCVLPVLVLLAALTAITSLLVAILQPNLLSNASVVVPDAAQWLVNPPSKASSSLSPYTCAPWLTKPSQRRVAFLDLATMAAYHQTKKSIYRGGEYYMSASLDYALRQNGFTVDTMSVSSIVRRGRGNGWRALASDIAPRYHRIFANGDDPWWRLTNTTAGTNAGIANHTLSDWSTVTCKIRCFAWWGNREEYSKGDVLGLDPKQWLKAYPTADYYNTFLGFFPHSILQRDEHYTKATRAKATTNDQRGVKKVGMILGKAANGFLQVRAVVQALLDDGFELHTTCSGDDCTSLLPQSPQLIAHNQVNPTDYVQLLRNCSFLLGTGYPYDSPSPIEGLANGVAFLNPIAVGAAHMTSDQNQTETTFALRTGPGWRATQHVPLSMLGMPYVYNVHLSNTAQVVAAANHAVTYRFDSFIPADYTPLSLVARVCAILEDDALCTCPRKRQRQRQDDGTAQRPDHNDLDSINCQGSSTIRKPTTQHDANFVGNVTFYT